MIKKERKESKWGEVTQKMMSFKLDLDLLEKLKTVPNKGRLINKLLREYFEKPDNLEKERYGDIHPDSYNLEEYMT